MKRDDKTWDHREKVVAGPGSNRSRAKARRRAKRRGNKIKRKAEQREMQE